MWGSPLHQNLVKARMKNESNEDNKDFVAKNNVANALEELKDEADSISLIRLRKQSAEFLRDKFRRHRSSLPNNNSIVRSVTDGDIGNLDKSKNIEKIYTFTNNNHVGISNRLSDELSNSKSSENMKNHLNNEITQCRFSRARSIKDSFGIRFPWSKNLASCSLPSSPMKALNNQQLFDGVINEMKDHQDSLEIHSNGWPNNETNDVTTRGQIYSQGNSDSYNVKDNILLFDIDAEVQTQNMTVSKNEDSKESITRSHSDSVSPNFSESESSIEFEDHEDLESTIRKLRQLLSQTDNSSGDSTVHPVDMIEPPSINIIESSQNLLSHQNSLIEELSPCETRDTFVDGPNATLDGRLFYNIHITDVEITELPKKTKNSPRLSPQHDDNCLVDASSLVFSISYDGMYIEEVIPQTNNDSKAEFASNPMHKRPQINSFKYTLEKEQVKRKYQEFVLLQKHIENKISVNSDIWSLKENSTKDKILEKFHTKFGNQKSNLDLNEMVDIQERKEYLEKWLIDICGNSSLCHAPELKEFLSYPVDDRFVVARKSSRCAKNDKVS